MEEKIILDQTTSASVSERPTQKKGEIKKYSALTSDGKNDNPLISKEESKHYKTRQVKIERIIFRIR